MNIKFVACVGVAIATSTVTYGGWGDLGKKVAADVVKKTLVEDKANQKKAASDNDAKAEDAAQKEMAAEKEKKTKAMATQDVDVSSMSAEAFVAKYTEYKGEGDVTGMLRDHMVRDIRQEIIPEVISKLALSRNHIDDLISRLSTKDEYMRLVTILPEGIGYRQLGRIFNSSKKFPEVSDLLLDRNLLGVSGSVLDTVEVEEKLRVYYSAARNMSEGKRSTIAAKARDKASKVTNKVVFGWFYIGMPMIDAIALMKEPEFAEYENPVVLNYDQSYSGLGEIVADMKNWKVMEFQFNNRSKFVFLNCEDNEVLAQTIHQYVLKKDGPVNKLELIGKINTEASDEDILQTYSVTRQGTKILFCEKDGWLRFIKL